MSASSWRDEASELRATPENGRLGCAVFPGFATEVWLHRARSIRTSRTDLFWPIGRVVLVGFRTTPR